MIVQHNLGRIGMNGRHRLRNKDRIPTSFDDTTLFTLKSTSMLTAPICTVLLWFSLIYYMDNTMSRQIWTHSVHEYVVQQTGMNVVNILDTVLIPTAVREKCCGKWIPRVRHSHVGRVSC
jgi:hypothetical protein